MEPPLNMDSERRALSRLREAVAAAELAEAEDAEEAAAYFAAEEASERSENMSNASDIAEEAANFIAERMRGSGAEDKRLGESATSATSFATVSDSSYSFAPKERTDVRGPEPTHT